MEIRDLFVATVALVLGCMMLYTAVLGQGWCYQMKISRVIAESKGQSQARTFIGSVGALLITIGLYLILAPFAMTLYGTNENRSSTDNPTVGSMQLAETE